MTRKQLAVESVAEAYLALLAERGIEYLFANAGTDFAPIVEAYAKAAHTGLPAPKPLIATHENLAMSMAHGYAIASGKVPAVMVHVSVGTANALCGVFNAARECVPILVTAGRSPLTEEGLLGARDTYIHWAQEMFDQAGMLRELVKWEYELRNGTQLETVIDRALSLATSAPQGPVYLSLPREVLAEKLAGFSYDSPSRRAAVASPGADDAAVAQAVEILADGQAPGDRHRQRRARPRGGCGARRIRRAVRDPGGRAPPAASVAVGRSSVPSRLRPDPVRQGGRRHPRHRVRRAVGAEPGVAAGRLPRRPYRRRPAVQPLSDPGLPLRCRDRRAAAAGAAEAERGAESLPEARLAARRQALAERRTAQRAGWRKLREEMATQTPIHPAWVSHCLSEARAPNSVLVNEYTLLAEHCGSTLPGSYFGSSPAAGLGWGAGAALGVKLAEPGRQVISILGDGSYIFSNPVAVHHASTMHKLPVLTIVINNAMWGAVRRATLGMYPDGEAARSNKPPFIDLDDLPAFETICEAAGGYGERVEDPKELPAAMKRALKAVDGGKQALLNVISAGGAGG